MNPKAQTANRCAACVTIIYVIIGYTAQLSLIVSSRSAAGLSPVFTTLGFLAFSCWVVSGSIRPRNYAIVLANLTGAVFSLALLIVWAVFR